MKNPRPTLWHEGDCGPCVIAGLIDWYPGNKVDPSVVVRAIYERAHSKELPIRALSAQAMRRVLNRLYTERQIDYLEPYPPSWSHRSFDLHGVWGATGWDHEPEWSNWIHLAMLAGCYAICAVNIDKEGPPNPANHWVMLCGYRRVAKHGVWWNEVLMSCSSSSSPVEQWVPSIDFLKQYGGFNCILVRPTGG